MQIFLLIKIHGWNRHCAREQKLPDRWDCIARPLRTSTRHWSWCPATRSWGGSSSRWRRGSGARCPPPSWASAPASPSSSSTTAPWTWRHRAGTTRIPCSHVVTHLLYWHYWLTYSAPQSIVSKNCVCLLLCNPYYYPRIIDVKTTWKYTFFNTANSH